MSVRFLHLCPIELGLNGEAGNLEVLCKRLNWSGIPTEVQVFEHGETVSDSIDAVFIGSGTLSGALAALEALQSIKDELRAMAAAGVPFFSVGLGWEILGREIELLDGSRPEGIGIFPSTSKRVDKRASMESFGRDYLGRISGGYSNHSAEISIAENAKPLIQISVGHGNSSLHSAKVVSDEGLITERLMATRLNGPVLAMNPHLADSFLKMVTEPLGLDYSSENPYARKADSYAKHGLGELVARLERK